MEAYLDCIDYFTVTATFSWAASIAAWALFDAVLTSSSF